MMMKRQKKEHVKTCASFLNVEGIKQKCIVWERRARNCAIFFLKVEIKFYTRPIRLKDRQACGVGSLLMSFVFEQGMQ